MLQQTLAMIKPEGAPHTRDIISTMSMYYKIVAMRSLILTHDQVAVFYGEHQEKPFFQKLLDCMTRGPITVIVLEAEDVIKNWRLLMGATNPKDSEPGTLRHQFAYHNELPMNVVHGSDSADAALREIAFFFPRVDLIQ